MTRTPCKLGLNYTCLTTPESIAITSQFKDQTGHCTHVVYFQEYVYAAHLLRLQSDPECVLQVCDFRCSTVVFPEHHVALTCCQNDHNRGKQCPSTFTEVFSPIGIFKKSLLKTYKT